MSFLPDLDLTRIPRHVGIVMDGNGRWARQRGLPRTDGHKMGEEALFDTVEGALEIGLPWLTVYGFSTENWRRPREEVRFLMNFNRTLLRRRRDELHDRGVRIVFTGRRDWRVPRGVLKEMEDAERLTRANEKMTLCHRTGNGSFHQITISVNAVPAHLRHGDVSPDQYGDCP